MWPPLHSDTIDMCAPPASPTTRHRNSPAYSNRCHVLQKTKTILIRKQSPFPFSNAKLTLCPQLNCTQRQPEIFDIRHQAQNFIGHPATVHTAHALRIEVFQQAVLAQIKIIWYLLQIQSGEQQIDFDAVKVHFDHRHVRLFDRLLKIGNEMGD